MVERKGFPEYEDGIEGEDCGRQHRFPESPAEDPRNRYHQKNSDGEFVLVRECKRCSRKEVKDGGLWKDYSEYFEE